MSTNKLIITISINHHLCNRYILLIIRYMTSSTSVSWEILNLAHKLKVILDHLQNQMRICKEIMGQNSNPSLSLAPSLKRTHFAY